MRESFQVAADEQREAKATELVEYLLRGPAPVGAPTGIVRAIARLYASWPIMRDLANGNTVHARELCEAATELLTREEPQTVGALALQSLMNWLVLDRLFQVVGPDPGVGGP